MKFSNKLMTCLGSLDIYPSYVNGPLYELSKFGQFLVLVPANGINQNRAKYLSFYCIEKVPKRVKFRYLHPLDIALIL